MGTHDGQARSVSDVGLIRADVVVVGGGLAGLWGALHLPSGWDVLVVDKGKGPDVGSSPWAQGGMAVAVGADDSAELHASDTIRAGAGLCRREAVEVLVDEARTALAELVDMGCEFDRDSGGAYDLHREGGQTVARSVHAADATGREIMRVVGARARSRLRRLVGSASDLLVGDSRCVGVRVRTDHGDLDVIARAVLLATGGCGALWPVTTNPPSATGDGIAMAYEAGADVADLEFMQFHPTALAEGGVQCVLLSEALRGAGAIVVDERGERFLFDAHPDGELAPRDVVARAIAELPEAFLDARPIGAEAVRQRFPNITAAVAAAGFDLTSERVPISPAAHYFLGGAATDIDGRTSLAGLYAAGECAATGVHGANRMAGNSLAEAVVFGRRAAVAITAEAGGHPDPPQVDGSMPLVRPVDPQAMTNLRTAMFAGAGLIRQASSLRDAMGVAKHLVGSGPDELRRAALTASLICASALERTESRGVHFRLDHPEAARKWEGEHTLRRVAAGVG